MKELSIEEKAKAYDEAIKRANELNYVSDKDSLQRKTVEHIFPELKESEDEKIRKEIIAYLSSISTDNPKQTHNWIIWLKKQGEQKHVFPKFRVGDTVKAKTMDNFMFTIKDITDKQYVDTNGGKYDIEGQDYLELVEQKPAWSEEDEKMYNAILRDVRNGEPLDKLQYDWLKSLKDRVKPQNKWKESLATADLENSLCDIQDTFSDTSYEYRILGEAIEFIRCTEQKPQWKLSDRELGAMLTAIGDERQKGSDVVKELQNIYQQLKKLKD